MVIEGADSVQCDPVPPYATPNPLPARAVYGFALFVCSWLGLALYLIWALLPTQYLDALQLTYVPAKYWAIAIPLLFPLTVSLFLIFVFVHNLIHLHGIFDDIQVIEDDFGKEATINGATLGSYLSSNRRRLVK